MQKLKSQLNKLSSYLTFELLSYFTRERGAAALITVLSVMATSLLLIGFFSFTFYGAQKSVSNKISAQNDFYIAEAGLEDQLYRIKTQKNYSSSNTLPVGSGQSNITVTTSGNTKTILSEAVFGNFVRRLQSIVTLDTDVFEFNYGVQVGEGGLVMAENSSIEGNVYSNGSIVGSNGAYIDGEAIVATSIEESEERSTNCSTDQLFGKENPVIDMAQSFKVPQTGTGTLAKISIYIKKVGDPGNPTIYITADSGGSPSTSSLASATLSSDLVTTNYGWIDVVFSSPPTLTNGSIYWIVFNANRNSSKYWYWCSYDNSGYGNGEGKSKQDWSSGGSWTSLNSDLNFKLYFGAGVNSLSNVTVTGAAKANTISNSTINGDAYYQTIASSSVSGASYPNSADQPLQNMPISDIKINGWKSNATNGGIISGDYSITTDTSLGPKQITGNLLMTSTNKTLTITGTVYVRGYINVDNGSTIKCDALYGTSFCIVIADGWIHIANNGTFSGSGDPSSYIMMMTTSNCNGSSSIGCTHHNAAVDIHNQATGVVFFAPNGLIFIHNKVSVTEVTSYKLQLENTAHVVYAQGLANASFSSGPGASWQINDWKEVE